MMLSILIPSRNEPKISLMIAETEKIFPEAQIVICNDRYGKGKGWAVRQALQEATGDIIAFIDGDFDISPVMLNRLLPFIKDYDIVVGKKRIKGRPTRKAVTWLSRIFIRTLFGIQCDSQTGVKLFKREALPEWNENEFMFDLEILYKAKDAGFKMVEVPVEVTPYGATSKKLTNKGVFKCFIKAIKMWLDRL